MVDSVEETCIEVCVSGGRQTLRESRIETATIRREGISVQERAVFAFRCGRLTASRVRICRPCAHQAELKAAK